MFVFLGCRFMNHSWDLVNCLREQDTFALDFWGLVSVIVFRNQVPNWMPVIDGEFVPKHPKDMWAEGAGAGKQFITGQTEFLLTLTLLLFLFCLFVWYIVNN